MKLNLEDRNDKAFKLFFQYFLVESKPFMAFVQNDSIKDIQLIHVLLKNAQIIQRIRACVQEKWTSREQRWFIDAHGKWLFALEQREQLQQ